MINGAFDSLPAARDLRFEKLDSRIELFHRKRIEILPGELGGRVVGATGKIVGVHRR